MFGRVRASSSSSLELLEMERTSSKIIKHDALSIYEATLLKLKQGSHCNSSYDPEDSAKLDANCIMVTETPGDAPITADAGCSSNDSFSNSSSISLKEQGSKNMSILYFFSKYKSPEHAQNSNGKEVMIIDYSSSSSSVTPTSSS